MSENNINLDDIICANCTLKHINNNRNSNLEGEKIVSKLLVGSISNNIPGTEYDVIALSKQDERKQNIEGEDVDKAAKKGKGSGQGRGKSLKHEMHIRTERERRKKMRNMFADLYALLPQLPPKADKSTIVGEAMNYIKTLEITLQDLQNKKKERQQQATTNEPFVNNKSREALMANYQDPLNNVANNNPMAPRYPMMFQTCVDSNVVLNIFGNEAQFSVCSLKNTGILTTMCYVFEKHIMEVLSAHVTSSCNGGYMYMFQTRLGSGDGDAFVEPVLLQETYKRAASEIAYWLSL